MPNSPQIIEYARASDAQEIRIRREGDEILIFIPAPPFWRLMTLALIRLSTLILLLGVVALMFYSSNPRSIFPLVLPWILLPASILVTISFTRVALAGSQPTLIRASRHSLAISPRGMAFLDFKWPASELRDIGVRQTGAFPILAHNVELRLILNEDRIETYNIPWNGLGALANIEDNLRDILGLVHDSTSTLNHPASAPSDPPSATIN